MNSMVILIRCREFLIAQKQRVEPLALTELEIFVHLDRFEWADLDADLAAHANRDVDVEDLRIKLGLAHVIRLLVVALSNIDALRRAFFLTNLARHTAQSGLRIFVVNQDRKIAVVLRQRNSLLRILHCDQPLLFEITSDEVTGRNRHSFEYARSNHLIISDRLLPSRYRRCRESPSHPRRCGPGTALQAQ